MVARNNWPIGLSEISRGVGLDKATTLRLLITLESSNLIQQNASTRRYLLGAAVNQLSGTWRNDLRQTARPYLKDLWRNTQETVCLACPRGLKRAYVEICQRCMSYRTCRRSAAPIRSMSAPPGPR